MSRYTSVSGSGEYRGAYYHANDDGEAEFDDTCGDEQRQSGPRAPRSINEVLQRALATASDPGLGDEEPEVLPRPPVDGQEEGMVHDDVETSVAMATESSMVDFSLGPRRQTTAQGGSDMKRSRRDFEQQQLDAKRRAMEEEERRVAEMSFDATALLAVTEDIRERSKYIPLRLSYEERKNLRTVSAAVSVIDYTTTIDQNFKKNAMRKHLQLQQIVAFLTGLVSAKSYASGLQVLEDRNFEPFEDMLQQMLEIARRYKVVNPEKMRSEYGKLVYLMQDSCSEEIRSLLGINVHRPIQTVYSLLEERGALSLLDCKELGTATEEILQDKRKNRSQIELEIRRKEKAANAIVKKFEAQPVYRRLHYPSYPFYGDDDDEDEMHGARGKVHLSEDVVRLCLYSIADNNSFLNANCKPISECIKLLETYFRPDVVEPDYSLSIDVGEDGARLSHSHEMQYSYVMQSLKLWEAIVKDMFRLWYLAEQDLLSPTQPYELRHTGQGLQRVQQSPRVYRAMHEILARTKQELGNWVGSSVIHLGDHNVPNTLVFIDKYTQVSRILGPLVLTLKNLDTACVESAGIGRYLEAYGGLEKAKKDILRDFFMHAFDGSGGDNFFDAGSCIDGRLTSAWHWCSRLHEKPYYPLFRLTGFLSFDGEFDK